jgi:hypothetical protein
MLFGQHVYQWMNLSITWLMECVIIGKVNANSASHVVCRSTLHALYLQKYFNLRHTQIRLNVF